MPEPEPDDPAMRLETRISFAMLDTFSQLVRAAKVRGFIRTAFIGSAPGGTAWWLLTARECAISAHIADEQICVNVFATFKEWTPADGVMCAIVQRRNNGLFPGLLSGLIWSFETVRGIPGLRGTFNLGA